MLLLVLMDIAENNFTSSTLKTFEWNQKQLEERLEIESSDSIFESINSEILTIAVDMFVFMNFCPIEYLTSFKNKDVMDFIEKSSIQDIILFLNRMKISSTDGFKDVASKALDTLSNLLSLQYKHISQLLIDGPETVDLKENAALKSDLKGFFFQIRNFTKLNYF